MTITIITGCCMSLLAGLPPQSINACVTSPPYWGLRDYGISGQFGLEATPEEFVVNLVKVFREVRRVLRDDGTLWINLGDSYAARIRQSGAESAGNLSRSSKGVLTDYKRPLPGGLKEKALVGIPWRVAFALQADGWYLRSDIIWSKPNPMPESVTDRPTKSHEYIFLLSKSERYYYDQEVIREPVAPATIQRFSQDIANQVGTSRANGGQKTNGNLKAAGNAVDRNKRSVWTVTTKSFSDAHFATYPPELIEPCILAGCPAGGTVLDPFFGAGTTGLVADRLGRSCIGIELNPDYVEIANRRLTTDAGLFSRVVVA